MRNAGSTQTATALDWLAALGTPMSILVAVLIGIATFWRRPSLSIHERREEWRVERNLENQPIPSVRFVVHNGRLHRAARGARVLVESYRRAGSGERIPLGSVPLGWTSAADAAEAAVVVFPDADRSIDLGVFQPYSEPGSSDDEWAFAIAPAFAPYEGRNVLRADPEGYFIRLIAGSDDGRARRYEVYVNWRPENWRPEKRRVDGEWNAHEVLDSVLMELQRVQT